MENQLKHHLGHRAFIIFLFRKIKISLVLFIITLGVWYSERWFSPSNVFYVQYAAYILLLISIAYFLVIFLFTWMEYRFYTYTFTEEAFMTSSGSFLRTEGAALYHQIQNVNIERSPFDRVVGVSKLVIFLTGSEKEGSHNKLILPAVGKTKAKAVQKELLLRARKHMVQ
jgi:membrane protein YdbS with pleckstrin-like domain